MMEASLDMILIKEDEEEHKTLVAFQKYWKSAQLNRLMLLPLETVLLCLLYVNMYHTHCERNSSG